MNSRTEPQLFESVLILETRHYPLITNRAAGTRIFCPFVVIAERFT